ncbi:Serine/threonine-protein kinase pkn1 [Lignipirellula cremea]|uniref:Serine/threonine-protein kinase pkn1 n=2 Tax=Lignipirellula cremea TaxID=2528010 RepID=A0A518DWM8_9BACT|nr:Serine/threonine-protein kinase pkn1 [Lignipirellula cremea]
MKLVFIPPGEFQMGSNDDQEPVAVTLTQGFYLGETEVTQAQWTAVMETKPWTGETFIKEGPAYAASYISWNDAIDFCTKLTEQEHAAGRLAKGWRYALPTESQWEYACRAGTTTAYYFGDDPAHLGDYAWFYDNAYDIGAKYAHEVRLKKPNAWTLYDMHGNVWEWCRNGYQYDLPGGIDPASVEGSDRVYRGGSWNNAAGICRSAYRSGVVPSSRIYDLGFRLAAVPVGGAEQEPVSESR